MCTLRMPKTSDAGCTCVVPHYVLAATGTGRELSTRKYIKCQLHVIQVAKNVSHMKSLTNTRVTLPTHLYRYSISDMRRKKLQHLCIAAEEAQSEHVRVRAFAFLFIAEGVYYIDHDGRWISDCMRVSICWYSYLLPLHGAVKSKSTDQEENHAQI